MDSESGLYIRQASRIFNHLLEKKKLTRSMNKELFDAYDMAPVQEVLKELEEGAACTIMRYPDAIYIMPDSDNTFLGYTYGELKKIICYGYRDSGKKTPPIKYFYLSNYIILELLAWFYSGTSGMTSKISQDSYMRVGELIQRVSDGLDGGNTLYSEADQASYGVNYRDMQEAWLSMSPDPEAKTKGTQRGYVHQILKFLDSQDLIHYTSDGAYDDVAITTKDKLDSFMDWYILSGTHEGKNISRWHSIMEDARNNASRLQENDEDSEVITISADPDEEEI